MIERGTNDPEWDAYIADQIRAEQKDEPRRGSLCDFCDEPSVASCRGPWPGPECWKAVCRDHRMTRPENPRRSLCPTCATVAPQTMDEFHGVKAEPESVLLEPAKGEAIESYFDRCSRQYDEREALSKELGALGLPVLLRQGQTEYTALASRDVCHPGRFRVTWVDSRGPSGHTEFDSLDAAIFLALREGYTPIPMGSFDPTTDFTPEGK